MNWLLRKVSGCHILKSTPPKDKLFALVCSIEESCKSSKSRPFLTNHVTRIEKKTNLKHKRCRNPKIEISINRLRTSMCLILPLLRMSFTKLTLWGNKPSYYQTFDSCISLLRVNSNTIRTIIKKANSLILFLFSFKFQNCNARFEICISYAREIIFVFSNQVFSNKKFTI